VPFGREPRNRCRRLPKPEVMTPYRDDFRRMRDLAQHVGIAEELLRQLRALPGRIRPTTPDGAAELLREASLVWERLWDQLGQARDLARELGRDVRRHDRAGDAAAEIWRCPFDAEVGRWRASLEAGARIAGDALSALGDAFPGAVIASPPAPRIDLSRFGWLIDYGPLIVLTVIGALMVWNSLT
jgi:hypothetical protein